MLVLTRKTGQQVVIGNTVKLTVVEVHGNRVLLSIDAPDEVRVRRSEQMNVADEPLVVMAEPEELEKRELLPW